MDTLLPSACALRSVGPKSERSPAPPNQGEIAPFSVSENWPSITASSDNSCTGVAVSGNGALK